MVATAGAGPWPQITSGRPLRTSNRIAGTSPPGPLRCGSTTWSVNAVAQAASKALPPLSNTDMPTAVAIQWVEVTTPNVPSISGRVVKGLGLMLPMGSDQTSTARGVSIAYRCTLGAKHPAALTAGRGGLCPDCSRFFFCADKIRARRNKPGDDAIALTAQHVAGAR